MKTELESYLGALAGQKKIVFCPNPGNAGDALIAYATFQLLDHLGLSYEMYNESSFNPNGATLIYGGGGSLISGCRFAKDLIERHHATVKKLIILPHTIGGNADLLGKLGPNVDIFAREEVSFEYVTQQTRGAQVYLADDLAFRLNARQILAADIGILPLQLCRHLPLKRMLIGVALWLRIAAFRSTRQRGPRVLYCFRTDQERTAVHRPAGNVDLSKLFNYGTATPQQAFCSTCMIFRVMSQFDEVVTNRLHMAVAGSLLGQRVKFYSNSYYKCEAVYRSSMEDRFPNVHWMGAGDNYESS